ncbi:unnamed protein product, partial [marine sediment metagenome]
MTEGEIFYYNIVNSKNKVSLKRLRGDYDTYKKK